MKRKQEGEGDECGGDRWKYNTETPQHNYNNELKKNTTLKQY